MSTADPADSRRTRETDETAVHPARGVYGITTAAELVGVDPQSLRPYERHGLLQPARTPGGTRRYSSDDIRPGYAGSPRLLSEGLNLTGIALVLDLHDDNAALRATVERTEGTPRDR